MNSTINKERIGILKHIKVMDLNKKSVKKNIKYYLIKYINHENFLLYLKLILNNQHITNHHLSQIMCIYLVQLD